MSNDSDERVLVIPRERFDRFGAFQGFTRDVAKYHELKEDMDTIFVRREDAERDPGYKQVIPYCVFARRNGDAVELLSYQRAPKGGDARLQSKFSIGIGGHINDGDAHYEAAMKREVFLEELNITAGIDDPLSLDIPWVGLINDDSNEVGRVHLGFVHLCIMHPHVRIESKDPKLINMAWRTVSSIVEDLELETWSRLCAVEVGLMAREYVLREVVAKGKRD